MDPRQRVSTSRRRSSWLAILGASLSLAFVHPLPASAAHGRHFGLHRVAVHIQGLKGDLQRNVRASLSLARKTAWTEPEIRSRFKRAESEIKDALQPFGYYAPTITSDMTRRYGDFIATFQIVPGAPITLDTVSVHVTGDGAGNPQFVGLVASFPLQKGDVLYHPDYEAAKKSFGAVAMKYGYLDGRFTRHEVQIDLERYVARIFVEYDTGPQYRFGVVEFHQDVVKPELLAGYITFRQGDPIDFDKLLALEEGLGKSPYFSRVEVLPDRSHPGPNNELPITVNLTPAAPEKYTFGVGYGTDNGAHVQGNADFRRINSIGHRANVQTTLSQIEQTGAVQYVIPWPYPRTDVLTSSAGYTAQLTTTSTERSAFVGTALSRLWAGWQENFALNFRRARWQVGVDQALGNFLVPEASWSRLRANNLIDPTDGSRLRFALSAAARVLLSSATYERAEAETRWIRTFSRQHELSAHLESGYTWTREFRNLPPSARFFAGGAQSVRGYGYNSLGARDSTGHVIGGEALLVGSVEYVYRIDKQWGLAAFYDAGNAMRSFREPLALGAGPGVRWLSPIGMVRLDLGFPLNAPNHRPQIHLAIGPGL